MDIPKLPPPKLPRVYRVTYEYDFFVLAHSLEAAENTDVDINDQDPDVNATLVKRSEVGKHLLPCLPYLGDDVDTDEDEQTLGQWFERIKEEDEKRKAMAEFLAKQIPLPGVLT